MQGGAAFLKHLGAGHLGAVQATVDLDLDALGAHAHGRSDGHLHGTAIGDLALDLVSDVVGHDLGVELGALHLVDVDLHVFVGEVLELFLELVDILTALADDEARTRGADGDGHQLERALDDDARHTGLGQTHVKILADFGILDKRISIITTTVPVGIPTTDDT